MLVIRFSRVGKRNHAQYKIVVAEKSAPIKGRFVEQLGSYDPHMKQAMIKEDRVKYWMEQGAQATDSVWNLLVREEIIKDSKRTVVLAPKKSKGDEEKDKSKKDASPAKENKKEMLVENNKPDKKEEAKESSHPEETTKSVDAEDSETKKEAKKKD